ncbi:hypothetical protein MXD81_14315, partial [Microbacteriaceae bacterium K1510]|nr:hypothetical protein [Microbacteriaceae bacterium K1510]
YYVVLLSVALVGIGSAVFHPESSRLAYMASGPRRGLGQSIFQVGGNTGQALAPIMTYAVFIPLGQIGTAWFSLPAVLAICLLILLAIWYSKHERTKKAGNGDFQYGHKNKRMLGVS